MYDKTIEYSKKLSSERYDLIKSKSGPHWRILFEYQGVEVKEEIVNKQEVKDNVIEINFKRKKRK